MTQLFPVPVQHEDTSLPTRVVLEGLFPDTEYVYRVVLVDEGGDVISRQGRFRTAPTESSP